MQIKKVGVVGGGIMGSGIAQVCAQAGYEVIVSDLNRELLDKGLASVDYWLQKSVEKGRLSPEEKNTIRSRIKGTVNHRDFRDCDLVIEAVVDNLEIKKKVFAELDGICTERAILATNTATLSVIDIAIATRRPDRVLGLHFFNPVAVMKLVEAVKTIATSEETLAAGKKFAESLGKTVIVAPDAPGFILIRMMAPQGVNAVRMLEQGVATREDIDNAARLGANLPLGPLELADMIGLDNILAGYENLYREYKDPIYAPPILLKKMVAAGWLGRKTGKGFYDYNQKNGPK